tara:strand:- start:9429 stop:9851 length:423 start_codon:yes stop_codon:yes gene_type:complete
MDDLLTYFGYVLIIVLLYLIFQTFFQKKEGFLGVFEDSKKTSNQKSEENLKENIDNLQASTNEILKSLNLSNNRSQMENIIIGLEERMDVVSLASTVSLSKLINKDQNSENILPIITKLNELQKYKVTLAENMKFLDGLK